MGATTFISSNDVGRLVVAVVRGGVPDKEHCLSQAAPDEEWEALLESCFDSFGTKSLRSAASCESVNLSVQEREVPQPSCYEVRPNRGEHTPNTHLSRECELRPERRGNGESEVLRVQSTVTSTTPSADSDRASDQSSTEHNRVHQAAQR